MEWINSSWGIDEDGVLIWTRDGRTRGIKTGDPIYCGLQSNGYMVCRTSSKPRRAFKAHHLIWYFTHGEWPNQQIDHIDGNRSNNVIENLRLATKAQNMQNRKPIKRSLPPGVVGAYKLNYKAAITVNGKRIYLGYFKRLEDAEAAYQAASIKLHQDFSYYACQGVI